MPIYEFKCDCGTEREYYLPFSESGKKLNCECGKVMWRKFSPVNFTMPSTGRDTVLGTLNQEEGAGKFPGGDKHRARYEQAMAKGLDYQSPLEERVFAGF